MTRITDKRKQVQAKPLTFADLAVGDWFEVVISDHVFGPRLKINAIHSYTGNDLDHVNLENGFPSVGRHDQLCKVRRLDVEIVIHGEKP